ncbi:type II toxin-antitoxin system VapC family toxin [Desulfonatronum thioautotrophicum]|uniref:type II toxin-antitoxin system VapC family toxin n=1 Tax=Desulfonatronum thioautotrophicum TaxID=617001 RepID=UPI0005EBCEBF|nr:type II toxin-antitoxin system VapC family toxin [Desulfonatronum thioautotrophicum]
MLILDTHIWIWWINQTSQRLPMEIVKLIGQAELVAISAISCFEVTWLCEHGRIHLEIPVQEWITQATEDANIISLPVSCAIAGLAAALPEHHKDPQDRIIIATSINHEARLVSADSKFSEYREIKETLVSV